MSPGRLDSLVAAAQNTVRELRPMSRALERRAQESPPPRPFRVTPAAGGVGVIAEVKRRSPSVGAIQASLNVASHAGAYQDAGAVAVSVLTERSGFGGSIADLTLVAQTIALPVLRKDFIVDELQVLESRAAGASAVLLIARILASDRLAVLIQAARGWGLEPLVEVHSMVELDRALRAGASVVGINNRDLDSFRVDLATAERLLAHVPASVVAVAESGIECRSDVERMATAGADAVLVGTALARLSDPRPALRALTGVDRQRRTAVA